MRSIIAQLLRSEGYTVFEAHAAEVALGIFEREKIDLAIIDVNLGGGGSGLDLLSRVRGLDSEVMGIIVTAYPSVESAVHALHEGAYDYITKPFANDHLKAVVRNALAQKALFQENRFLRRELREKYRFENIIGKSDAIEQVFRVMEKVARTDSSVLITGESGTGKELVARAIHFTSERAHARFLPINCGALPENLLESELFGYKRGAFTGASQDKVGLLKAADKGTMLFDEIGEMPLALQVKLLRAFQERECYPLGSNDPVSFDVRVLCATNRNLEREVKEGRFREELLYRINVITIALPALRERRDDIPLLANHFLRKYEKQLGRSTMRFSKGAMRVMVGYAWPGNVRELENTRRARRHPGRDRRPSRSRPARQALRQVGDAAGLGRWLWNDAGGTRARAYPARADPRSGRQGPCRRGPGHPSLDALPQGPALSAGERGLGEGAAQSTAPRGAPVGRE